MPIEKWARVNKKEQTHTSKIQKTRQFVSFEY
jgi:hypothetical protein